MSYCTQADLTKRLSDAGVLFVSDDDLDDEAGTTEKANALGEAILYADAEIDAALTPWFTLPITQSPSWLKFKAIDICLDYLASRRGGTPPESIAARATMARESLEQVRTGKLRVPGLTYPADGDIDRRRMLGVPRFSNPRCG